MINFNETIKNISSYFDIKKKIVDKLLELDEIEKKILEKKQNFQELEDNIEQQKKNLEALKTGFVEFKDFINSNLALEFEKYDYKVDITDCYVIDLFGKKYISLKTKKTARSNWCTIYAGYYYYDIYKYYDVLNRDSENKYKLITEYQSGHFELDVAEHPKIIVKTPCYEKHILELYPELTSFIDNYVPNTYLKKIYYEINELGNKKLVK